MKKAKEKLSALAVGDRTLKCKRHRIVRPFMERFTVEYRTTHPGPDKTTVTPALKEALLREGTAPVSESTVGRTIYASKAQRKLPGRYKMAISAETGDLRAREPEAKRKKQRCGGFVRQLPGDLVQMDAVSVFLARMKLYIFTALHVKTHFAFAYRYLTNSSANGNDSLLVKALRVTPFAIKRLQTDNGTELTRHLEARCEKTGLTYFFNYPKHPQSNGFLKRFNRTIQEQFVYLYEHCLDDLPVFNTKLMEYLVWYETQKPHRGIYYTPPLRYHLDHFLSPKNSSMLWTVTTH